MKTAGQAVMFLILSSFKIQYISNQAYFIKIVIDSSELDAWFF